MNRKHTTFTAIVKDQGGNDKEVELAIMKPDAAMNAKARMQKSKAFREAMDAGAPLRDKMDQYIRDQGLWDDAMEERFINLSTTIAENENIIVNGGCKLKRGYDAAINLRRARNEIAMLMHQRNQLDAYTCEGQADNAEFDCMVSLAVVDNVTGSPYFKSYEDYLDHKDTEIASQAARLFAEAFYGVRDDFYKNLPENKFLLRFNFCNEDLHLIDKQGRLIDTFGRLVNKNGELINEDGELIDELGNLIDEHGNTIIEQKPFLDDDGNPLGDDGNPIKQEEPDQAIPAQPTNKKSAPRKKRAAKTE